MVSGVGGLQDMAETVVRVPGVRAVVLGGSRAHGTHHDGSDVDLGIYDDGDRLDLDALSSAAGSYDDRGSVELAGPGAWGPWVDGGGWLVVDGTPVDWILRDLGRVRAQCRRARAGEFAFHVQPGHPLGFLDVAYAAEIATCLPLADPSGVVGELRSGLEPYPPALRAALVRNLWQAGFLVAAARKGVPKGDRVYVTLCCGAALLVCAHAWHAAAGSWVTNEKGLVVDVARLDVDSHDFAARADLALRRADHDEDALADVVEQVSRVVEATRLALEPPH